MKLQVVRTIAKQQQIKPGVTSKAELIKKIQLHEGNFSCYGTATLGICDQTACLWREDCIAASQE